MKEKILYGTKKNEADYMEEVISTQPHRFDKVIKMATDCGYDRFRVAEIDLSCQPDFVGAIN